MRYGLISKQKLTAYVSRLYEENTYRNLALYETNNGKPRSQGK